MWRTASQSAHDLSMLQLLQSAAHLTEGSNEYFFEIITADFRRAVDAYIPTPRRLHFHTCKHASGVKLLHRYYSYAYLQRA